MSGRADSEPPLRTLLAAIDRELERLEKRLQEIYNDDFVETSGRRRWLGPLAAGVAIVAITCVLRRRRRQREGSSRPGPPE
jgi:hypothetical protein